MVLVDQQFANQQTIRLPMRKEFNTKYDQAITLIKDLKQGNDYLNRAVGVESPNAVALRIRREHNAIQLTLSKVQALLQQLEQSYLDPDTARKIGTLKQQFRIQRDRRKQLLLSAEAQERVDSKWEGSNGSQRTDFSVGGEQGGGARGGARGEGPSRHAQRQQEPSRKGKHNSDQEQDYEQMGVDFEVQHRIMQERNAEISDVSKSLMNVHSIMEQTSKLTFEQGGKIDIIGDELFETYRNVREARQNLSQANQHQKRARRKYVYFSLMVLLGVAVALILLLA